MNTNLQSFNESFGQEHGAGEIMSKTDSSTSTTHFEQHQQTAETIGTLLRNARETKGYSIKKISHHTKISTSILERLENDRLSELPSRTYVNGFVKSFAQVVELDLDKCMQALERTYTQSTGDTPHNNDPIRKAGVFEGKEIQNPHAQTSLLITVGIVLVMVVLGIFINRDSSKQAPKEIAVKTHELSETTPLKNPIPITITKEAETTSAQTTANTGAAQVPTTAATTVSTTTPPPTPVVSTTVSASMTDLAATSTPLNPIPNPLTGPQQNGILAKNTVATATTSSTVTEKVEAKKEEVKAVEVKKDPALGNIELKPLPTVIYSKVEEKKSKESLSTYVPSNMQVSVVEGKQNVFITAVEDNTWITYKKDDEEVKKFVLEKGKNILIRGDEIRIFLGNVNATRIFLNNSLLDVASKSGVKSLVFPKENANKYKLPLFIYKDTGEVVPSNEL